MKKIGIVTVTYNCESVIDDFFDCLISQDDQNFILYIIDNFSIDHSLLRINKNLSRCNFHVNVIKNNLNLGIAKANNQGIKLALRDKCDYILIANNDITFDAHVIQKLLNLSLIHPNASIAPKILFESNKSLIWSAGGHFSKLRGVPRVEGHKKLDSQEYNIEKKINSTTTCFLFVPSNVFSKIGLMDEDYFVYLDDSDFVMRLNLGGFIIIYCPTISIYHKVSISTGGSESVFTIYEMTKNTILFLYKNYNFLIFLFYFIVFFFRKLISFFNYNKLQAAAALRGYKDGLTFILTNPKKNIPRI
jgi:GT2 family glycosyltransferase